MQQFDDQYVTHLYLFLFSFCSCLLIFLLFNPSFRLPQGYYSVVLVYMYSRFQIYFTHIFVKPASATRIIYGCSSYSKATCKRFRFTFQVSYTITLQA